MSDLRQQLTRSIAADGSHLRLVAEQTELEAVEEALGHWRKIIALADHAEKLLLKRRNELWEAEKSAFVCAVVTGCAR